MMTTSSEKAAVTNMLLIMGGSFTKQRASLKTVVSQPFVGMKCPGISARARHEGADNGGETHLRLATSEPPEKRPPMAHFRSAIIVQSAASRARCSRLPTSPCE